MGAESFLWRNILKAANFRKYFNSVLTDDKQVKKTFFNFLLFAYYL